MEERSADASTLACKHELPALASVTLSCVPVPHVSPLMRGFLRAALSPRPTALSYYLARSEKVCLMGAEVTKAHGKACGCESNASAGRRLPITDYRLLEFRDTPTTVT